MLAQNQHSTQIVEFIAGDALHIGDDEHHIPLKFSMVVLLYQGQVVLINNQKRKQWELPGGGIEPGEQPHEAAIRELYEEAGQQVETVRYVARLKFAFAPDRRLEFGALYTATTDTLLDFTPNEEVSEIMLWDMQTPYPEPDGKISRFILTHAYKHNLLNT
ncbi:MAG: NUDIX domain-containing protein [Aggregatilineales bacterium]